MTVKYGGWTECPECGLDLEYREGDTTVTCPYCSIEVPVPIRKDEEDD